MTEAQIESGRGSHSHQMTNPSSENENIHRDLQKTSKKSRIGLKLFENEAFKVVAFSAIFCSICPFLPILCSYFLDTESCCSKRVRQFHVMVLKDLGYVLSTFIHFQQYSNDGFEATTGPILMFLGVLESSDREFFIFQL